MRPSMTCSWASTVLRSRRRQHSYFNGLHTGPVERNRSLVSARIAARLDAYDRARADLPVALNRFAVLYVEPPRGEQTSLPRPGLDTHLGRTHMGRLGAHSRTRDVTF